MPRTTKAREKSKTNTGFQSKEVRDFVPQPVMLFWQKPIHTIAALALVVYALQPLFASAVATPTINLGASSGGSGSVVSISGAHFHNGDTITVTITGHSGNISTSPITVSGNTFSGTITIPGDATLGADTVTASDTHSNSANASFTVKLTPTVSVTNPPVTYNGSPQSATVSGSVAGTVSDIKYNGLSTAPTNAGTYPVTADFTPTDTSTYNSLNDASAGNFTINTTTSATVISCPESETYTGSAITPCSATATGAGGLNQSVSVNYTNNIDVGTASADATFAGDSNHTGSSATEQNFEITTKPITVTATGVNKVFDGNSDATVVLGSTDIVEGDDVSLDYDSASFADSDVGTDIAVHVEGISIAGGEDASNYSLNNAVADTSADITEQTADVSLVTEDLTQTYNGSPRTVGASVSPEEAGPASVLYEGSPTAPTNAGSYDIVALVTNPNYSGSALGTLTVNKANQTINFGELADKTFGDADFEVSASASSELAVSFGAEGQCTVSENLVHLTGVGSCTITASQSGNGNYNAAPNVAQSFNISEASTLEITNESHNTPDISAVTITWTTNHVATSRVIYDTVSHSDLGEPSNYGYAHSTEETDTGESMTTTHSVTVTGLTASTLYFFRAVSHGSPEVVGDEISATTDNPAPPSGGSGTTGTGGGGNGGNGGGTVAGISTGPGGSGNPGYPTPYAYPTPAYPTPSTDFGSTGSGSNTGSGSYSYQYQTPATGGSNGSGNQQTQPENNQGEVSGTEVAQGNNSTGSDNSQPNKGLSKLQWLLLILGGLIVLGVGGWMLF